MSFSKSQLDRLGERLREGEAREEDLRSLDEYRRSFSEGYEYAVRIIRDELELEPSGRPAKSTTSIRDKLMRESIRLSQMQDIAGCRIVVSDVIAQNDVVGALRRKFGEIKVFDRRIKSSHGYRAVHLIAQCADRFIEIQVRSHFQHIWAEISEKTADMIDPAVKYGGGPSWWQAMLQDMSNVIGAQEGIQARLHELQSEADARSDLLPETAQRLRALNAKVSDGETKLGKLLERLSARLSIEER